MESLWYFDLVAYTGILCLLTSLVLLIANVILWTLAIKHKKRYQALEESKNMAAWLACKCLHFCSVLCADCFCFSRPLRQLLWRLKTFFSSRSKSYGLSLQQREGHQTKDDCRKWRRVA